MTVVRVQAVANTTQAVAQFNNVTAAVARMNAAMAESSLVKNPSIANAKKVNLAAAEASKAWTTSIAHSEVLRAEQVRIGEVVSHNTDLLKKHKLAFNKTFGKNSQGLMKAIYREQLAMAQGYSMVQSAGVGAGRTVANMAIPTQVHKSWDTLNNRIGMFRYRLASASNQMVNWGKNVQWTGRQLSAGLTMPIVAFGAAAGYMAYTVDKELTRIAKVYDTTANSMSHDLKEVAAAEKELMELREAGLDTATRVARDYGASVTDTLKVQADLAATGQRGLSLQKATAEVQRIATLGELDQQTATKATIALQQIFRQSTDELTESFNYMNAIENATSLTTRDFATAIPIASATVREFGGDIQELGVLLTAMASRGIQAGRAANGIKAAMQRLGRPSKQVQEEFRELTGGMEITELVDSSGSLTEIFTKLYQVTKDLEGAKRRDVFAGLFGSYQVSTMTALVDGMEDINNQYGQTYDAQQIANRSTKEWADIADREMKRYQESVSGRFKIAWESVRAQLATMGEPFLAAGGMVLKVLGKILKLFNKLPDPIKNFAAMGLIFAAMVGPVIMLVGLFANFAGSIGKAIASSLRLISTFEILNKEEWATRATSKLVAAGFTTQATAAELLETQLKAVAQATNYMAAAMAKASGIPLPAGLSTLMLSEGNPFGPQPFPMNDRSAQVGMFQSQFLNQGTGRYHAEPGGKGPMVKEAVARAKAEHLATKEMQRQQHIARGTTPILSAQEKITQTTKNHVNGAAVSMGVMGLAAAAMMLPLGETVTSVANFALIAAIAVPAMKGIAAATVATGIAVKQAVVAEAVKLRLQTTGLVLLQREAGLRATILGLVRGTAAGMSAIMGPIGWLTVGLTAAGFALYKFGREQRSILEQQVKNQESLTKSTDEWADILDTAVKKQKQLSTASWTGAEGMSASVMAEKLKASEDGKALIAAYEGAESDQQKGTIAAQQYLQILNTTKATAAEASAALEALFLAAGDGALEAQSKARELWSTFGGDVSQGDMTSLWKRQFSDISEGLVDDVTIAGTQIGQAFAASLAQGGRKDLENKISGMSNIITGEWDKIIASYDEDWQSMLNDAGISASEFGEVFKDIYAGDSKEDIAERYGIDMDKYGQELTNMYRDIRNEQGKSGKGAVQLVNAEVQMVKELSKQLGIQRQITTLAELQATYEWKLQTVTRKTAQGLLTERLALMEKNLGYVNDILDTNEQLTDVQRLEVLNQIRLSLGMEAATSYAQGFVDYSRQAAGETGRIADNLNSIGRINIEINDKQLRDVLKSGYEGVVEDYADGISDNFDSAMQNAVDSNSKMWDTRIEAFQAAQERAAEAMDRRHERITDAFDKRWEDRRKRIEDGFENRIDKINETIEAEQKAEDIRQRIFEAEQARLDRLTESANRGIDFNMALQTGDLDEAAKIRNDMDAAAQQWALADAAEAGGRGSENRQDRLEDRIDNLEDRKDKVLDALKEEEEARRKALERRLDMEKKHLEKVQDARLEALQEEADANKAALERSWEQRRDNLNDQLELFKSFIPKNQKQLENWIKMMGDDFRQFGTGTLSPLSDRWGSWFRKHLHENMRKAGAEIGSDNMWESMSADIAKKTIKGLGFGSISAFERFIKTGQLPKNFGKKNSEGGDPFWVGQRPTDTGFGPETRHTGGIVGEGGGSRKGVARTAGLHSSERLVLARKGERIIDRTTYQKHAGLIDSIADGGKLPRNAGGFGGGLQGLVSGIYGAMFMGAAASNFSKAFTQAYSGYSAGPYQGLFGTAAAGTYGDVAFSAEQLANAATIASVGKRLGASQRDIIIALMTAMQESTLRNLDWGDRDSVGLFQQRNAWGSFADRTNPAKAAEMFFKGGQAGQRGLFDFPDRDSMSLTEAAQAVQVSAFPDAYAKWENEARAIFAAMRYRAGSGYTPGSGGKHRPINKPMTRGLHDQGTAYPGVDFAAPVGTPVYAVASGTLSYTERKGYEPRNAVQNGYYSYGKSLVLRTDGGPAILYAHLNDAYKRSGRVEGGAKIAATGDTGYSTGPHLHFGATNGPLAWLKTGGMTLNDGIAMLHRGETVLTEPLTQDLQSMVRAFGKVSRDVMSGRKSSKESVAVDRFEDTGFWTYLSGQIAGKVNSKKGSDNTSASTTPGTIRTGAYNVAWRSSDAGMLAALTKLQSRADVLSLNEVYKGKQDVLRTMGGRGWGSHGVSDSFVIWKKAVYDFIKGGTQVMNPNTYGKGPDRKRNAAYALLKNKATGQQFWQIAAHTQPWPNKSPFHKRIQQEQFRTLSNLTDKLGATAPVVLAGDLNESVGGIKIGGLRSNWEGNMKKGTQTHGNKWIDHVMYNDAIFNLLGTQTVGGLSSDHNAVLSQLNIPSHRKGAGNIKWDNTLVNLHKKESVLSEPQSDNFRYLADNLDKIAMGAGNRYDITVEVKDTNASPDAIANKVLKVLEKHESRKPQRRR